MWSDPGGDPGYQTLKALDELLAARPDDAGLLEAVAHAAAATGDDQRVQPILLQLAQKQPNSIEGMRALSQLATMERKRGNQAKAQEYLETLRKQKTRGTEADSLRNRAEGLLQAAVRPPTSGAGGSSQSAAEEIGLDEGGMAYSVNEQGVVFCREAASKRERWRYELRPRRTYLTLQTKYPGNMQTIAQGGAAHFMSNLKILSDTMELNGDLLLVPNLIDGVLHAIDKNSGQRRWLFTDWSAISPSLVMGDKIYLGNSFGDLLVLSRDSGKLLRRVPYPIEGEPHYYERIFFLQDKEGRGIIQFNSMEQYALKKKREHISFPSSHSVSLANYTMAASVHVPMPIHDYADLQIDAIRRSSSRQPGGGEAFDYDRYHAIQNLRDAPGRDKAISALRDVLKDTDADVHERIAAAGILAETTGKAVRPTLDEFLNHRNPTVRAEAIKTLGTMGDKSDLPVVVRALDDLHIDVRREALDVLLRMQGVGAKSSLRKILDNPDSPLRGDAIVGLFVAGDLSFLPLVREYAKGEDFEHESEPSILFMALCKGGDPAALAIMEKRMAAGLSDEEWQSAAAKMIGRYFPERSMVPFLAKGFHGSELYLLGSLGDAATALAGIGDPAAVEILIDALPGWPERLDPRRPHDSFERNALTSALEALTGESFGNSRARWQSWWQTKGAQRIKEATP